MTYKNSISYFLFLSCVSFFITACGGNSHKNTAPVIEGIPVKNAQVNENYIFEPVANDVDGDPLRFSIVNKPSWANFDVNTGVVSGLPDVAGDYNNITISVSDGKITTNLAAFDISVTSQALKSDVSFLSSYKGASPFISFLQFGGASLSNLQSLRFTIAPKPGSASKAVDVTYSLDALKHRSYVDIANKKITLPIFGLYSGYDNQISVQLYFVDNSSQAIPLVLTTDPYVDPHGIYDQPVIIKRREVGSELGFNFFAAKSNLKTPVVIDTDGEIRWLAASLDNGFSTFFYDNSFIVGLPGTTKFRRLEMDGSYSEKSLLASGIINFHHNIDMGKIGFLGEFDSPRTPEIIVSEFSLSGAVIKQWDFEKILSTYMISQGDDPSSFIREAVDWFHSNATTYDPRDNSLIVSSRENFIIKIDYDTGNIIWVFGDPTKFWYSFPSLRAKAITLEDGGLYPIGQHSVSITSDGLVMVFNNGLASVNQPIGMPVGESRNYSLVSAYRIDDKLRTAKEEWRFDYNKSIYSGFCSSVYEAPSKSLLISYAVADAATKSRLVGLDKNHEVLFDLEYRNTGCNTSWNAVPVNFENMVFNN